MRFRVSVVWMLLLAVLFTTGLRAQGVVDPVTMRQAMLEQQAVDAANQRTVLTVLARSEVSQLAGQLGLDLRRAESAVRQMGSEQLAELATSAHAVEADLAGGQQTITISVVTLLLIIIIVLLID